MVLEHIYIARHGFRQSFEWPNNKTGTPRDPPLTAFGVQQAKELAEYFQRDRVRLDAVFSSPWYRCLQTATPVAEALDLPINVEFGISEFFMTVAPNTGVHPRPQRSSSLQTLFPRISTAHRSLLVVSQNGETISGVHSRAKEFLRRLVTYIERQHPNIKSVLLVSHAAFVIALGRALMYEPQRDVRAGTASLSHYIRLPHTYGVATYGNWRCGSNGGTEHLKGGEQRHWGFDDEFDYEEPGIAGLAAEVAIDKAEEDALHLPSAALAASAADSESKSKHKL